MPYTATALNNAVNGIATAATWISLHTADPSTTGTNEATGGSYARQQTTWGSASSGSRAGSQVTFSVPAGTYTHWGIWSASSAGTFHYGGTLSSSETYGSPGSLLHTPTITVTN